ncbi:putative repeat protein (TIGR01451 family)/choice-of-anchor A domain-containing protein [Micromonospora endolithica]|nr:putative repeat protein (TIGR01451 family)/choice-of-anchor A domain-containing protein [Micromonospora endolithica]
MAAAGVLVAGGSAVPPARPGGWDLTAVSVGVGPVNPVAPAQSFGVMTEGDATVIESENEGTMAVGGNLAFGNYQLANNTAGSFVVPGDARPSALVVGGRVDFAGSVPGTRLQVLSSGYAKVGNLTGTFVRNTDNNGAQVNTRILPTNNYDATPRVELTTRQPVDSVGPTSPLNFAAAYQSFRSTSAELATCENTVVLRTPNGDVLPRPIPPGSNAVVSLTPGVTNVLDISATDLNNISILTFASQPTASTPLLVNVDTSGVGDNFSWNAPNFAGIGGEQARYILFNFPTATRLTLTPQARTVEGSLYAPNADHVDLSATNTEGSVITRTFEHRGGEMHYFPFSTTLACQGATTASIDLVKSSTTTEITTVGQQVPYRFHVVNTGGVPLEAIAVTDVQTPPSSNANLGPITCPQTTLAPGAQTVCTATYTVTQADLDNGSLRDTATARGTPPGGTTVESDPAQLTIPAAALTAAIRVTKSSTTTTIGSVGQQVPYRFDVINTGGLTLTGVAVTDVQTPPSSNADLGPITCAQTTLSPGASTTCTATYTVTQADLDNGGVTNTATARGTPPTGAPVVSPPSSLTIPDSDITASIRVTKSSTTTGITAVGQQVPYRFDVVNTGGLTLTGVAVTDVQTPPSSNADLGPITCAQTTLAPGASTICTATYTVTQADLDNGGVTNTATARGTPPTGAPVVSPPSSLTIPDSDITASIDVVKTSTTIEITTVGQEVPYRFHVVNTGGLTLTGVAVTDVQTPPSSNADLGPITCAQTTLAPGARTTCTATYTVSQADLDNGAVSNTATARGTPPGGGAPVVSPPSSLTIPDGPVTAAVAVVKSATTTGISAVGQQVPYEFLVVNTGGLTLTGVAVTDVQTPPSSNADLGPITCPQTTLAPGASTTCTATYTVSQADLDNGGVTDTATARGTPPRGEPVESAPSELTIPNGPVTAAIALVKSSTTTTVTTVGQEVPYRFHVVNTGALTLTGVAVTDVQTPPSSNADLGPITCAQTTLAPGVQTTCTATYTVTQADLDNGGVTDTATARGTPPGGGDPVVSEPSTLTIPDGDVTAAIAVVKHSTTTVISAVGQQVPYLFHVVNTGGLTLTGVTITDVQTPPSSNANLGPITCAQTTLAPGASTTCTATYTVTQADLDNGGVTDTATARGTPPGGGDPVVSEPSTLTIPEAGLEAGIHVVKSSTTTGITEPGQQVPFTYLVVNTGGFTLTGVTVNDTLLPPAQRGNLSPILCGPENVPNGSVTLAPGESIRCRATYTVSESDYAQSSLLDVATATGTPPTGPKPVSPPSPFDLPVLKPSIALAKSVTPTVVSRAGETVTYRFVVTNTGNTTLDDVTVEETAFSGSGKPSAITCGTPPVPNGTVDLAPGGSTTCTATYTVTASDVDAGRVTNTAVATGTPPDVPGAPPLDPPRSGPSSATVTATEGAAISVAKSSPTTVVHRVGEHVPYRFLVTNTGTVTLTGVTVTDRLAAPADPANLGPITCGPDRVPNGSVTLAAGAAVTCEAVYKVSKADVHRGSITNTATATGRPPSGPAPVAPESTLTIPVKGKLPVTGESLVGPLTGVALLILLLGTALVVVARRRRTPTG